MHFSEIGKICQKSETLIMGHFECLLFSKLVLLNIGEQYLNSAFYKELPLSLSGWSVFSSLYCSIVLSFLSFAVLYPNIFTKFSHFYCFYFIIFQGSFVLFFFFESSVQREILDILSFLFSLLTDLCSLLSKGLVFVLSKSASILSSALIMSDILMWNRSYKGTITVASLFSHLYLTEYSVNTLIFF